MRSVGATRLSLLIAVLGIVPPATPLQGQDVDPHQAVAATVNAFHGALAGGDTAVVLDLLAPDAHILEGGGVETVEEYVAGHMSADMAFARAVPRVRSELRVVIQGEVAWVTSTSRAVGTYREREVDSQGGELMVLTRDGDGRWRIRAISWS